MASYLNMHRTINAVSKNWIDNSIFIFFYLLLSINANAQFEPGNNLGLSYMQLKEQFPDIYPYGEDNMGTVFRAGVKEDGTPNDVIVTQFEINDMQYGWGTSSTQSYAEAVQKNSYVKCREISLSYQLPSLWTKKFGCERLIISAFARNPFYLYRTLKLFDSETTDGTNWIYQAQVGGSTASARTFGVSLRASF